VPYDLKVGSKSESRLFAIPMLILNRPNNKVRLASRGQWPVRVAR
jgi:hypothetical protein